MANDNGDIAKKLENAAFQPSSYELDGEKITQRSAKDVKQLLDMAAKRKLSTRRAFRGIGVAQVSTPGSRE